MRKEFPTSLEKDEITQYIYYLVFVGGIFVLVALILYVTVIGFVIASKKWKRFSTERVMQWRELHRRKGHIIFIITTIFVFFLVVFSVIYGLVENARLHDNVVLIAVKPTTIIQPTAQVVLNVNETVGDTGQALEDSIVLVERVLDSVGKIAESIGEIHDAILGVQLQFDKVRDQINSATSGLPETQHKLEELASYQDEGYITDVPDSSQIKNVDDIIDTTLDTADQYLDTTIDTINDVLIKVNTTIADAVEEGNNQVNKAKVTLAEQIDNVQSRLEQAVESLRGPNDTIASISSTAVEYGGTIEKALIVIFVFALVPLILVFIGLVAKVPLLYKFAFAASFLCMFWLIAIGGVFAVVHTAFTQACDNRELLVINGIHKFTPTEYRVDLGNINIGPNRTNEKTEILISLNSTTLHDLLNCKDPRNIFDVFDLETLIDTVFGQIYAALDQLQAQQASFFATDATNQYLDINIHERIADTTDGVQGFQNATQTLVTGNYLDDFYGLKDNMVNISQQAVNMGVRANEEVNSALEGVNNVTRNFTTTNGDMFSIFYSLSNISEFDIDEYPFSDATTYFRERLSDVKETFESAVQSKGSISEKVDAITDAAGSVLDDIVKFQDFLKNTLNITIDVNDTIDDIQKQLDYVSDLVPELYKNITEAIDSIKDVLQDVSDSLRSDTQCGFAGEFFNDFSGLMCKTGKKNAQAMSAALLIMGIAYFFVCILGVGLQKRNDVHKLMAITEKGLQKLASFRVIDRTVAVVNDIVRSTSEFVDTIRRPSRPNSTRNVPREWRKEQSVVSVDSDASAGPSEAPSPRGAHVVELSDMPPPYPHPHNHGEGSGERYATVKFADVSGGAAEREAPVGQVTRSDSLGKITSALRAVHRRTTSITSPLAQVQEIPYTELEEIASPQLHTSNSNGDTNSNSSEAENTERKDTERSDSI